MTLTLSDDCQMTANGCLEINGFSEAHIRYLISVNNVPMIRHDYNMCELMSYKLVKLITTNLGLPKNCPFGKVSAEAIDSILKLTVDSKLGKNLFR
jgi:hypothetical protein